MNFGFALLFSFARRNNSSSLCPLASSHTVLDIGIIYYGPLEFCAQASCTRALWLNYVLGWYIRVKISVDYDSTLLQIIWTFINNCTDFHHGYVKLTKPGICDTFFVFHFQTPTIFKLRHIHIHRIATINLYDCILLNIDAKRLFSIVSVKAMSCFLAVL